MLIGWRLFDFSFVTAVRYGLFDPRDLAERDSARNCANPTFATASWQIISI
jgi:hypothetical protein